MSENIALNNDNEVLAEIARNLDYSPETINYSGKIERFSTNHNPNNKDGWYIAFDNISNIKVVLYACWTKQISYKYISSEYKNLTPFERKRIDKEIENKQREIRQEREKEHREAREKAITELKNATETNNNEYLIAKQISDFGLNFKQNDNKTLLIDYYTIEPDKTLTLSTIQYIFKDKETGKFNKRFKQGGQQSKSFHPFKAITESNNPILLCEGVATGATIYEALERQYNVYCVGSCHNFNPVYNTVKAVYSDKSILLLCDNDSNGLSKNKAIDCNPNSYILPDFTNIDGYNADTDTDFNDLYALTDLETVKKQLVTKINEVLSKVKDSPDYQEQEFDNTDKCNADLFIEKHGRKVKYIINQKYWMVYNEKKGVWEQNDKLVFDLMQNTCIEHITDKLRNLNAQKETVRDKSQRSIIDKEIGKFENHLKQMRKTKNVKSAIEWASSNTSINTMNIDIFDSYHSYSLVNCTNGTVDLRTGKLNPHNPDDLITLSTGIAYNENAEKPEEFLNSINKMFPPKVAEFMLGLFGYSLIAMNPLKILPILYGATANNGKSTLLNAVVKSLGQYGITIDPSLLLVNNNKGGGHNESLANCRGARIINCPELPNRGYLDENLIKIATGNDKIRASKKHQHEVEFDFLGKIFITTNNKPVVSSDKGMWARLILIPCTYQFTESERKANIDEILRSEAPGILKELVQWAGIFIKNGKLDIPQVIKDETEAYQRDENSVMRWADLNVKNEVKDHDLPLKKAYENYEKWSLENGEKCITKGIFKKELEKLGWVAKNTPYGTVTYKDKVLIDIDQTDTEPVKKDSKVTDWDMSLLKEMNNM